MVVLRNGRNTREIAVRAPIPSARQSRVKKTKRNKRLPSSEYIETSDEEDVSVVGQFSRCGDPMLAQVLTLSSR